MISFHSTFSIPNLSNEGYVLKLSDFHFVCGWMLRPLAAWISKREYTIYQMVEDISGIPDLGPRFGKRGYFHQYNGGIGEGEVWP